jgi:hypothetical protein
MIVKLDHDSGAMIETSIRDPGGLPPVEIARGLLTVLLSATRVRVWEDGRSFLDPPSADETRDPGAEPMPTDDALRKAREALAEWLADGLGGALEGLDPTSPRPSTSPRSLTVWDRWYTGMSGVGAAAQRSDGFTAPV